MGRRSQTNLPDYAAVVGTNVRSHRKRLAMTQNELATAASLSRATIATLELGRSGSIELGTVGALARALKVSEYALLAGLEDDGQTGRQLLRDSPWHKALSPSDDEERWLASLPARLWAPLASPPARFMADLLDLRRRYVVPLSNSSI